MSTDGQRVPISGSPPHMRGKVTGLFFYQFPVGITPAYAGKSKNTCTSVVFDQDHPRVCGEKVPAIRRFAQIMGSPPRMRGKGHRIPLRHPLQGITPAYAGKSSACRRTLSAGWDHPRICGEKAEMGGFIPRFSGSPPRMRGKVLPDRGRVLGVGITPAYAGKSFPTSMFRSVGRDHPRICGEKIVVSRTWCSRSGLPPRMWGKVSSIRDDLARVGITPAYAGKSSSPRLIALLIWDHPRVCGEKNKFHPSVFGCIGSPPRMRGKVSSCRMPSSSHRITPAYAGKSCA